MKEIEKEKEGCNGVVRGPVRTAPEWPPSWIAPSWEFLKAQRWGPSLNHDLHGLDVHPDRPLHPEVTR